MILSGIMRQEAIMPTHGKAAATFAPELSKEAGKVKAFCSAASIPHSNLG